MFFFLNFGISLFKILDQFNLLYFEICEFNHFNQILLSLFDILSIFDLTLNVSKSINNSSTILKYIPNIK